MSFKPELYRQLFIYYHRLTLLQPSSFITLPPPLHEIAIVTNSLINSYFAELSVTTTAHLFIIVFDVSAVRINVCASPASPCLRCPRADDRPLILCLSRRSDSAGGNYDSRFDVGKASGTLIVARPLDAEQKSNYNLTVEATDGTRTVSTQVIEALMKRAGRRRPRLTASEGASDGWSVLFVGMC